VYAGCASDMGVLGVYDGCSSERVGWVPADNEVPEAVKSTYQWIEGLSVTEMEIMHGAYRKDNPNGKLHMITHLLVTELTA